MDNKSIGTQEYTGLRDMDNRRIGIQYRRNIDHRSIGTQEIYRRE